MGIRKGTSNDDTLISISDVTVTEGNGGLLIPPKSKAVHR